MKVPPLVYLREGSPGKAGDGDQAQHHAGDVPAILSALVEDGQDPLRTVDAIRGVPAGKAELVRMSKHGGFQAREWAPLGVTGNAKQPRP